jgi:hypothetical protein
MSRTKEGRDALRSSEAHPQARSIAPPWPERRQRRVPIGRHRPKSSETGETCPLPQPGLRAVRRRGAALLRYEPPLTDTVLALRQGSSTKSTYIGCPMRLASCQSWSTRMSMRSRAVSFALACCAAMLLAAAYSGAFARASTRGEDIIPAPELWSRRRIARCALRQELTQPGVARPFNDRWVRTV